MEHGDGGILDLDDVLCDVADDKDRVSDAWVGGYGENTDEAKQKPSQLFPAILCCFGARAGLLVNVDGIRNVFKVHFLLQLAFAC